MSNVAKGCKWLLVCIKTHIMLIIVASENSYACQVHVHNQCLLPTNTHKKGSKKQTKSKRNCWFLSGNSFILIRILSVLFCWWRTFSARTSISSNQLKKLSVYKKNKTLHVKIRERQIQIQCVSFESSYTITLNCLL